MEQSSIRAALAEHISAYGEVTTSAMHQWSTQLGRRIAAFVAVAILVWLTLIIGIFVAILATWNTPYRWWVAGGILAVCVLGIMVAMVGAARALHTRIAAPWIILADELATDLSGQPGVPPPIDDDAAAQRLQQSREQLQAAFARPMSSGGGAKVGLGLAAMVLTTVLKRRSQFGGLGLILPLGLAALRFWRRRR
ncbi:MAG: hypothetical protein ABI616_08935 [Pseudomonadota bacterium]